MDIEDSNSPKTKYTFKSQQLYLNSHGSQQLQGNWKKKFVSELNAKSKTDRFQKLMQSRNINESDFSRESFRKLLEQEWELFRNQEGLSHFNKEEMADFLLSLQEELMNPDEDIIRMYEEQQEYEAQALLEQISQYQQDYDELNNNNGHFNNNNNNNNYYHTNNVNNNNFNNHYNNNFNSNLNNINNNNGYFNGNGEIDNNNHSNKDFNNEDFEMS
jgi:hypothetical protein